jgi:hypothetical protein
LGVCAAEDKSRAAARAGYTAIEAPDATVDRRKVRREAAAFPISLFLAMKQISFAAKIDISSEHITSFA